MMTESTQTNQFTNCDTCQLHLADYVQLELSNQAAEQVYPLVAAHLETCDTCERLYFQLFRSQGQATPLEILKEIHQRPLVANVLEQVITSIAPKEAVSENWYEIAFANGRAWLDKESDKWRQLSLSLPALDLMQRGKAAPIGLMGDADQSDNLSQFSQLTPAGADFELKLAVSSDESTAAGPLYRVTVAVIFKDRFGDFSGTTVTLLTAENSPWVKQTDDLGKVEFSRLQSAQLATMRLIITLPE